MSDSGLSAKLDYFNMVHGVTLRAIAALSDADLEFRPQPTMRTAKDMVFHIYSQERVLAEAVREGRFTMEAANLSSPESEVAAAEVKALATVGDLRAYAEGCHRDAEKIFRAIPDQDLDRPVESPFGTYPSRRYLDFA